MLARSSIIEHPLGIKMETPIMVPSFSSKGYGFKSKKKKSHPDESEVFDALKFSKEFLTESLLVSAYDVYYKHIPFNEELIFTEVTLIDSGGYETGGNYDLSTVSKYNYDLKAWSSDKLENVLDEWPQHKAAIAVSYDHGNFRSSLDDQINSAEALFAKYQFMMSDFLIKPETKGQKYIQVENIIANVNRLKSFSIIGVTERELGSSILERMQNIAKIRQALDEQEINSPMHIFGSLDPITSILYFLAGAEIFDGLTWLKYSYYNNSAIYIANFGVLHNELGINLNDGQVRSMVIAKNAYYLQRMKYTLKDFVVNQDFKQFDDLGGVGFGDIIEKCYRQFQSNI